MPNENDVKGCCESGKCEVVEDKTIISLQQSEFDEKITPKKITDPKSMFMVQCPKCEGVHFRHAGYVQMAMPYITASKEKKVAQDSHQVMVCVKCREAYVWYDSQLYNITDLIDLEAWEKAEKELYDCTGPGGEC